MRTFLFADGGEARNCEGVSRRDFLKVGGLTFFGFGLADFLRMRAAGAAGARATADAVILFWLGGGPSHLDTFDPKPEAPAEIRGEFRAIPTNVDGIQISEHLPMTAQVADKLAIIRSVTSQIAAHEQASQYMLTGYRPLPTLEYPSYGAVVSKELGVRNHLPPYVAIPDMARAGQAGFIGAGYNAFTVGNPAQPNFRVANITLPPTVTDQRLTRRRQFIERLNGRFLEVVPDSQVRAVDSFYEGAYRLVSSPEAQKAFRIDLEDASVRDAYGRTIAGQGALLARRLVEAGARFVTISIGGWDTHQQNFPRLANQLLPPVDRAFATLVTDLAQRGMLQRTLVLLMGEFGRTPRINGRAGRDHWSRCRSVVMAGGGVRGGQVIGKSDEQGGMPVERPVRPEEIAATLYHALGVDYRKQYMTPTGRPIRLVAEDAEPIRELLG